MGDKGPFTPSVTVNANNSVMMLVIMFLLKTMELQYLKWVTTLISNDSILFNENSIVSVIVELTPDVNGP